MANKDFKAQGTIEYLVIIAVVVVLSLVVVWGGRPLRFIIGKSRSIVLYRFV